MKYILFHFYIYSNKLKYYFMAQFLYSENLCINLISQVILYDWKNCDQLRGEDHNKFCFSSYYSLAC